MANNIAIIDVSETADLMKGSLTLESFLSWLKSRMEHWSEERYSIGNNSHVIRIISPCPQE
jgi:hypothetical protein